MSGEDQHPPVVRLPQLRLHYGPAAAGDSKSDSDDAIGNDSERQSRSTPTARPERKRPRYLSDIDRSIIIQRLEKGEKQADLAREFGVTRAAICHINKNKDDVLTRFDEFARSPHGRVLIENYSRPSAEFESVTEVRTASATVLTTRIKDKTTPPRNFRASADRLIKVLLEEALVSFGEAIVTADSFSHRGVEFITVESSPCAVALEREGVLMLEIFREMEPEAPTGSIRGTEPYSDHNKSNWQVLTVDLPRDISSTSVLLLVPVFTTATLAVAAIEELRARGVLASSVCIVCVSCAFDAARDMAARQPEVTIITAALDKQSSESGETLDDFIQRYYASTTETSAS